ncbi:hypothetical protein ACH4TV_43675 [Streptomyces sp. NPDC020898]|uniref:hypothetical protein n=1 Tax=Streptomyces sp. NPDC020898 TaxID=3365101 RepID=UPI0037B13155
MIFTSPLGPSGTPAAVSFAGALLFPVDGLSTVGALPPFDEPLSLPLTARPIPMSTTNTAKTPRQLNPMIFPALLFLGGGGPPQPGPAGGCCHPGGGGGC